MSKVPLTATEVRALAEKAARDLDGLHGDPARHASWIRERKLAEIVLVLLDRAEHFATDVEVRL
jgi:hypothetical protein